jgi:hypothetical protein
MDGTGDNFVRRDLFSGDFGGYDHFIRLHIVITVLRTLLMEI